MTPQGHRHFKSQKLGAVDLGLDRETDVDGHAHPLMLHPAFEVAWYSRHPAVIKFLREWGDGWLAHMEPGKYATSVEVATEKVVSTTDRPLYGGYGALGSAFVFLYWVTDDERYLQPFFDRFAAGSTHTSPGEILPEILQRHGCKDLTDTLPRLFKGSPHAEWILAGRKGPLIDALKRDLAEMQHYGVIYTSAEPFTDRIFLSSLTNAALCYTGGYATRNKFCHTHAASWEGFGTEYAALVRHAKRDHFQAFVYNFADRALEGALRLWTLDHGLYRLTVGVDRDDDSVARVVESLEVQRASAIPVVLPPKAVTIIELKQEKRLDDIYGRADLALSASEVRVEGDTVLVVVHNIGSKATGEFEAVLVDARGEVRKTTSIPSLQAPLDLVPKRTEVRLEGLPGDPQGWSVVLDPKSRVPEIYEGNNRVMLGSRVKKPTQ